MLEARLVETKDDQLKTQLRHIITKMEEESVVEVEEEGQEVIEEEEYEDENEEEEEEEEEDADEEQMSISDFSNDIEFDQFRVSVGDVKKWGTEKNSDVRVSNQL